MQCRKYQNMAELYIYIKICKIFGYIFVTISADLKVIIDNYKADIDIVNEIGLYVKSTLDIDRT